MTMKAVRSRPTPTIPCLHLPFTGHALETVDGEIEECADSGDGPSKDHHRGGGGFGRSGFGVDPCDQPSGGRRRLGRRR